MNKKLFALLTSTALMAGFVPSVFADAATEVEGGVKFVPQNATYSDADEKVAVDVYVTGNDKICSLQFNFDVTGGTIVEDIKQEPEDPDDEESELINVDYGFTFDQAGVDAMKWNDKRYRGLMTEEDKKEFPKDKDYKVVAFDSNKVKGAKPDENGTKIGTVYIIPDKDASEITVNTNGDGIANYNIDAVAKWSTVGATLTKGDAPSSSEPEPSSSEPEPSSSEPASSSSSQPASSSSSQPASSSSSQAASSSSTAASSTSSKTTNNTTANTNTGAASTAAVALAASAAALVVISKKRK